MKNGHVFDMQAFVSRFEAPLKMNTAESSPFFSQYALSSSGVIGSTSKWFSTIIYSKLSTNFSKALAAILLFFRMFDSFYFAYPFKIVSRSEWISVVFLS